MAANGIIMTQGGYFGGNALLLMDGKPTFLYALALPRGQVQGTGRRQARNRQAHDQDEL